MNKSITNTRKIVESALMIALSVILCELTVFKFPFGGSVTFFGQLPIIILSYRYGVKWGLFSGFTMSVFEFIFGLENLSYVAGLKSIVILIIADYLVAFTCLGLGGMFKKVIKNQGVALALGGTVVSLLRYLCHFVSGITIWQAYAGDMPVWKYSLSYNGSYMIPELIITVLGALLISLVLDFSKPDLIRKKDKNA